MLKHTRRFMILFFSVLLAGFAILKLLSFTGGAPVRDQVITKLPDCPSSPNCVCSQDSDELHSITPLRFSGDPESAWTSLQQIVTGIGGKLAAADDGRYARYEFRSRIFGYVDDVECLLNTKDQLIEIRSASRSGHSDFGVNRKRVELIWREFENPRAGVTSPE
jgi:uncharacterized protein (DUF1499 family)